MIVDGVFHVPAIKEWPRLLWVKARDMAIILKEGSSNVGLDNGRDAK